MTITKADVASEFLKLSRSWVNGGKTTRGLIDDFVRFYREVYAIDADHDLGDVLMFNCSGEMPHHLIDDPVDMTRGGARFPFSDDRFRYVGLSREFWPPAVYTDDEDDEDEAETEESYGDVGIGLSMFMYFEPSIGSNSHLTCRASGRDELEDALQSFLSYPLVSDVLDRIPTKVTCFICHIG